MTPRLVGVVGRGVFKPLGHIHLSGLRGRDAADGSGTTPLSPRVPLPTSSKTHGPLHRSVNGSDTDTHTPGVPAKRPLSFERNQGTAAPKPWPTSEPKTSRRRQFWRDEHRGLDDGAPDWDES
jgi:hypothetical protein